MLYFRTTLSIFASWTKSKSIGQLFFYFGIDKRCDFFLLIILICLLNSCNNSTPKTMQEPYTVFEQQNITLSYLIKDDKLYYERITGMSLLGQKPGMKVYTTVTNTSDYGGVFRLYAKLSSQGNVLEFNAEQYIGPGATVILEKEMEINPYSFEANVEVDKWGITAPTKSINVPVTKYRTVEIK